MTSAVRKLYIDSRHCEGTPSDFTFQLPQGVSTDNTMGIVLSQLSMPNAFNTVMADFNDVLYFGLDLANMPGIIAGRNDRVFVRATNLSDGFVDDRIITLPPGLDIAMTWLTILQTALRTVWADWTVRYDLPTGSNQILTPGYRVVFPSLEDITNPTWARDEWKGPPYDWQNSRSVNRYFLFGNSADGLWTGSLVAPEVSVHDHVAVKLPAGQYDGPGFAQIVQSALRSGASTATGQAVTNITVSFTATTGTLSIASPTHLLQIFDAKLLRNRQWVNSVWYDPAKDRFGPALTSDPRDANRKIPSPQTFANTFTTSTIDLSGLRELYVHSSLSDYGTLSSIGMRDIIAVISVDSDWGNMVYYRPVGLSDQEVIQLPDNGVPTNIRIYLTDSYGTILPVASASQYVFVQLSIVPYQTM